MRRMPVLGGEGVREAGEQAVDGGHDVIAAGDRSCQRVIASSLAARIASCDSTTESGGSPPADAYGTSGESQAGIKATDDLVFVVDSGGAVRPGATS